MPRHGSAESRAPEPTLTGEVAPRLPQGRLPDAGLTAEHRSPTGNGSLKESVQHAELRFTPEELWSAIANPAASEVDEVYGRPLGHRTKLDKYSQARQHDLFARARRNGATVLVAGIEAKACEDFAGIVADRAASSAPSKKRARCNLLAAALFGREVFDEETGDVLDRRLSRHGYQLWTAAVGTIIEA